MGREKAHLDWRGESFLSTICRNLKPAVSLIVVVGRGDNPLILPEGAAFVVDRQADIGPMMGLATGLDYLSHLGIPWAFVTTCDAPTVKPELALRFLELAEHVDAVIPTWEDHIYGLTAVYRTGLAQRLFELIESGHRRVRDLPQWINCRIATIADWQDVDPHGASFRDIDTPEDYTSLLATCPESSGAALTNQSIDLDVLSRTVAEFVRERAWETFHSPKNLSMSLAIEAAELMEHFQWLTTDESRLIPNELDKLHAVAEEMADVFCYLLALANELDIDLGRALLDKMAKNRLKYPVEQFRGRFGEDDPRAPIL